jgi:phosphonate degradation associated HDIG domain protein
MNLNKQDVLAEIKRLFTERGASMYAGEPVTQTEHALQSAWQAEREAATASMITAALLHDVGHLLHQFDEDCADHGIDDRHEQLGAKWLQKWFGPDVCEPVMLHVPAKRYRCAVDSEYRSKLSAASTQSLQLQGGPMSDEESTAFQQNAYFEPALQLRTWDEAAKEPCLETPPLDHFLKYVEKSLR